MTAEWIGGNSEIFSAFHLCQMNLDIPPFFSDYPFLFSTFLLRTQQHYVCWKYPLNRPQSDFLKALLLTKLWFPFHGVQGTLTQNMRPWHIEYLKLKDFEKRAEAGRSLWSPTTPSPVSETHTWKLLSLYQKEGQLLVIRGGEFGVEKSVQILLNSPLPS